MNFLDILNKITELSEATTVTAKGRIHKADPGGYGRKYDTDEEGEEAAKSEPEAKRGRGRPKKGSDESGNVKKYDFSAYGVKHGKDIKLPKWDKNKTIKHRLKEYFDALDQAINEGEQISIVPAQQNTQVIKQGNKTLGTVTNPQLAAQIKQSIGKGEMSLAGSELDEESDGKWIQKAVKHPGAFTQKAKAAGKSVAAYAKEKEHAPGTLGKQARLAQTLRKLHKEDMAEADIPPNDSLASPLTLEEGMEHRLKSARHAGKAHALAKEGYNCRYEDMEEAKCYHEGYKEGLDECYGQMPVQGYVGETTPAATVPGMASQSMPAMEADMEEGNAFTAALAKTPKGGKFSVGGKTFTDKSNYNANVDEMAFEGWDNQLNALLESKEEVTEGMSVSISQGQQGAPDTVSVSAQDGEAEQLLSLIKKAGLGLFGGDQVNGYGAPSGEVSAPGGIDVVDDQDGMMSLIKKVTGHADQAVDYKDEQDSDEGEMCGDCGHAECQCEETHEMVDEVESEDQMTAQVAEESPQAAGQEEEEETTADENAEAEEDKAAAEYDDDNDDNEVKVTESTFMDLYQKLKFLSEETKDEEDDKAEKAGEEVTKDIEYDDKKDKEKIDEWANEAGQKGTDAAFQTDIDFMMNVISSGLNKRKSTGQTTIPVIAGQEDRMHSKETTDINESVLDWKKLAGIK